MRHRQHIMKDYCNTDKEYRCGMVCLVGISASPIPRRWAFPVRMPSAAAEGLDYDMRHATVGQVAYITSRSAAACHPPRNAGMYLMDDGELRACQS